jgi:hypothetical protein
VYELEDGKLHDGSSREEGYPSFVSVMVMENVSGFVDERDHEGETSTYPFMFPSNVKSCLLKVYDHALFPDAVEILTVTTPTL